MDVYCCKNCASDTKLTFFMASQTANKKKIFNDPVYGFINIPDALHFDLIEHPVFQRLRRIKQLGLTHLVYPGALHTRFHHSLGAMHLMQQAINVLRSKGHAISHDESQAASVAILLHDIGHGPYSHTLERVIAHGIGHEQLTVAIIQLLKNDFGDIMDQAKAIFNGDHPRKFLGKLVSSQLDMDRLDYLRRDSFFTGVAEGTIGTERLLAMLNATEDHLVIEAKGIYSVEKFLVARRLMYWQVYLHKTVLAAEHMLVNVMQRARELGTSGHELAASESLSFFLKNNTSSIDVSPESTALQHFLQLDDFDIMWSLKQWQFHPDKVLSLLSRSIVNRRLFKVELSDQPVEASYIRELKDKICKAFNINETEAEKLLICESTSNKAYSPLQSNINILYRDGSLKDISEASDQLNISVLSKPVTKYFVSYPKDILG